MKCKLKWLGSKRQGNMLSVAILELNNDRKCLSQSLAFCHVTANNCWKCYFKIKEQSKILCQLPIVSFWFVHKFIQNNHFLDLGCTLLLQCLYFCRHSSVTKSECPYGQAVCSATKMVELPQTGTSLQHHLVQRYMQHVNSFMLPFRPPASQSALPSPLHFQTPTGSRAGTELLVPCSANQLICRWRAGWSVEAATAVATGMCRQLKHSIALQMNVCQGLRESTWIQVSEFVQLWSKPLGRWQKS